MRRKRAARRRRVIFVLLFVGLLFVPSVQQAIKRASDWLRSEFLPTAASTTEEPTEPIKQPIKRVASLPYSFTPPASVSDEAIRDAVFDLTNALRSEHDALPLLVNETLERAANVRAQEVATSFSHTRPNDQPFHTILLEEDTVYRYALAGENLAMGTHYLPDEEMAVFLFEGWVESEGHFKNMIEPRYKEIGIGVYYDGKQLYLVQIFGTPY